LIFFFRFLFLVVFLMISRCFDGFGMFLMVSGCVLTI
jgi:hypothetical protein